MKAVLFIRNALGKLCEWTSMLFLLYSCVIITVEVFLRYIFKSGIVWSGASARYAVIWSIMLMGSVLIKDDDLIRADFFDSLLPKVFLKFRDIIYQIITFVIFCLLVYFGWKFAQNGARSVITYTNISMFYVYLAVPVGAAFMAIQFLLNVIIKFYHLITGNDPTAKPDDSNGLSAVDQAALEAQAKAEAEALAVNVGPAAAEPAIEGGAE